MNRSFINASLLLLLPLLSACSTMRGSGDLGLVVERADGSLLLVETTNKNILGQIAGLGDLSHASIVYSRDGRYGYVFGRDGGLTKVDLLRGNISKRIIQSGNSIGGAISQDGRLVAVSNYKPGGVRIFNSTTLESVVDIAAIDASGRQSKVVGLVDAPGDRFVFSLFDSGEIWVAEIKDRSAPVVHKFTNIGHKPYDALLSPDGRYYIAGLFGEDGMALLDLWNLEAGVKRILPEYGRGKRKLPVYKMPHLEGWAVAGDLIFVPAIGQHEVLVIDRRNWKQLASIAVHGQPVFVMARPDARQVWVNFAHPRNDTVQVIDTADLKIIKSLTPGKAVLHMEFTPRGEQVWISVRDADRVDVYDTDTFARVKSLNAKKPSGIFFTSRANKIGL